MAVNSPIIKAYIVLEDKTVMEGESMGARGTTIGEVVFSTGMTGYQETLTDPSYFGQIVTQTFPLIGNYGINSEDYEGVKSWVKGYIVREWCELPSNFRSEETLDKFLREQNIIGICGVDTRHLTKKLREHGVMNGMITTEDPYPRLEEIAKELKAFAIKDAVKSVSVKSPQTYLAQNGQYKVVLYDFGYKKNILRSLNSKGCDVIVVPSCTTAQEIVDMHPDGIMLSNGPGDPAENVEIIENLKKLMQQDIPIFGICLGHQLLALANGAKSQKLKYGHRGSNQPVKDLKRDRTYITSQNHGYAIVNDSVDPCIGQVSHINANDQTCEGIRYVNRRAFTVQFHPEASAGPKDSAYLFDEFISMMEEAKTCR